MAWTCAIRNDEDKQRGPPRYLSLSSPVYQSILHTRRHPDSDNTNHSSSSYPQMIPGLLIPRLVLIRCERKSMTRAIELKLDRQFSLCSNPDTTNRDFSSAVAMMDTMMSWEIALMSSVRRPMSSVCRERRRRRCWIYRFQFLVA